MFARAHGSLSKGSEAHHRETERKFCSRKVVLKMGNDAFINHACVFGARPGQQHQELIRPHFGKRIARAKRRGKHLRDPFGVDDAACCFGRRIAELDRDDVRVFSTALHLAQP